ncbi:MAG: hypothetical protein CBB69_007330 [Phycisphaera sp. TMED9]|nr:MAG: hypothetical protein CBB69_007330 [Phycisphaera sp. TMED9]
MTDASSPRASVIDRCLGRPWAQGRWGAIWVAIVYFVGFSIVWTIAHELSDLHAERLTLTFDWESHVPFQPWAIPLYFTLDISVVLLPLVFRSAREAIPPMGLLLLQVVIAAPFFVLLPIENTYLNDMPTGVWGAYLFEPLGMKNVSQWNQTPSLHVTYSLTVATVVARRWGGIWWVIGFAWAIPVSITTMLVHEHHLICVAGGLLLFAATIPLLWVWGRRCGLDARGRRIDPVLTGSDG